MPTKVRRWRGTNLKVEKIDEYKWGVFDCDHEGGPLMVYKLERSANDFVWSAAKVIPLFMKVNSLGRPDAPALSLKDINRDKDSIRMGRDALSNWLIATDALTSLFTGSLSDELKDISSYIIQALEANGYTVLHENGAWRIEKKSQPA